ncbi:MBL fold metallo-hydrolase [Paenibacillus alvei]|uniref:MBL fold metallo-hydrolase n=1 Tax=Paenibacillus alvei TaxID=44250 RepID=UPI0018CDF550|nr:MBL fold metallo-hydrolase [Paenibacillus alvei]MBG9737915.1 beta-lactamase [Paenibacillus alvei]MBG9747605.1 beta-lactamase [Paenibacillus alvei]MCY9581141.1 MBL fold metallo-hydrolase [Paenibacillus alvei]MCY9584569.1 MBL fold metallo-hydrolase [Paenibacillus alvei]
MKRYYVNMDDVTTVKAWNQFRRWQAERKDRLKTKDYSYVVPNVEPDIAFLNTNQTETTITWIGHSTFLLQIGGLNIVTDPIWATRMATQARLAPPGIPIEKMPPVDIVIISHSHYDHLHIKSLRKLTGPQTKVIVPDGLLGKMKRKGFSNVHELAWWEHLTIAERVKITFVPAQHWTRRTLTDMNRSHWGGYVLEHVSRDAKATKRSTTKGASELSVSSCRKSSDALPYKEEQGAAYETIYFAGDSGYFRGFELIGERFRIDVALLPIGAYEPEWFMSQQHVSPEEALQAFEDVKAAKMIPMHYGAFKLADDTPKEALDRLEAERVKRGIAQERVCVLAHGEIWNFAEAFGKSVSVVPSSPSRVRLESQ